MARFFEKRHDNVLRDIDDHLASSILRGRDFYREAAYVDEQGKSRRSKADVPKSGEMWFRPATVLDTYGREQPAYDMTRDGFTLLVMGYPQLADGALRWLSATCMHRRDDLLEMTMSTMRRAQLSVPLDPELRAFLERAAEREDRSLAGQARHLIAEAARRAAEQQEQARS